MQSDKTLVDLLFRNNKTLTAANFPRRWQQQNTVNILNTQ